MKLEIDTEKDSRATLKGVLRMLQAILGEEGTYSNRPVDRASSRNIFEDDSSSVSMYGDPVEEKPAPSSSSEGSGGLFNMFGNPDTASSAGSSAMDSPTIEEEKPEDEPQIQIY